MKRSLQWEDADPACFPQPGAPVYLLKFLLQFYDGIFMILHGQILHLPYFYSPTYKGKKHCN